jgi:hypothetical protein
VRDYGRGIPLGKLIDCVSIINTGAKYDSETFQKSVGLNGVGQKAVNALSFEYRAQAFREGRPSVVEFSQGKLKKEHKVAKTDERNGTLWSSRRTRRCSGRTSSFARVHRGHAVELRLPQPRAHADASTARRSSRKTASRTCFRKI